MVVCSTDTAREDFVGSLQAILPKVNLAFFSLAGAALRLGDLHSTLLLAAVLFTARALAVYGGALIGCRASGAPMAYRKCMWQTMLTQVRCQRMHEIPQLLLLLCCIALGGMLC